MAFKRPPLYRPWLPSDDDELKRLASAGASLLRASAALKRSSPSIKNRSILLGVRLIGMREAKRRIRVLRESEPSRMY
jgi:hypothetical protein